MDLLCPASLLWMTEAPEFDAIRVFSLSAEVPTKLRSGSANCVSARRFVIEQNGVFFIMVAADGFLCSRPRTYGERRTVNRDPSCRSAFHSLCASFPGFSVTDWTGRTSRCWMKQKLIHRVLQRPPLCSSLN